MTNPFYEDQPLNELQNDINAALKANGPANAAPDFKRYDIAGKNKDLK